MSIIIKPKDLELTISKTITKRLNNLKDKLKILNEDLTNLNLCSEEDEIPIGSRVLINLEDGTIREGRVWGKKRYNDNYEINKDGNKTYQNIDKKLLTNLSTGTIGKLEREIWLTKTQISQYEKILENSELPVILMENKNNIVEVVNIENYYPCDIISFVLANNLQSGKLKIPNGIINKLGYYEIRLKENTIESIIFSSETAFKLSNKGST